MDPVCYTYSQQIEICEGMNVLRIGTAPGHRESDVILFQYQHIFQYVHRRELLRRRDPAASYTSAAQAADQ